ncbi:tetratricopeptide repeat protein [Pseudanabaena sp. PCC 6802]|uniref:tetratricopeptide repeat protein n=1 Tax=Pseudanabaena sp. PCC 6802 TaxID=118173 RepID=UPI00034D48F3|nr:tetratricopeptide repeat protein [Pseudanabaena sp. PCC 6802]
MSLNNNFEQRIAQLRQPQELMQLADTLLAEGQIERAIDCYRACIERDNNLADAYLKLAKILQQQGKVAEAAGLYRQASTVKNKNLLHKERAIENGRNGASKGVSKEEKTSADLRSRESPTLANPETFDVGIESLIQQAETYLRQGNAQNAIATCQKALQINSQSAQCLKLMGNALTVQKQISEALRYYVRALEIEPSFAEVHANLGSLYAQQQNWEQAISHYQRAIALKPNFSGAYRNLDKIFTQLGKFAEAAECRFKALQLEPKRAKPADLNDVGNILWRHGKADAAIAAYRQAIQIDSRYMAAYFNLAAVLSQLGQLDASNQCYRKALELRMSQPDITLIEGQENSPPALRKEVVPPPQKATPTLKPDASLHLAEFYLSKQQYDLAIDLCQDGVHRSDYTPHQRSQAWRILGAAAQATGKPGDAERYYQKALQLQSNSAVLHDCLGSLHAARQQWPQAVTAFQTAIKIDPQFAPAYRHLAEIWMQLGKWNEGAEYWYRAFQLEPGWATAREYLNLGNMLLQQGKLEKTVNSYQRAIQVDPDLWQAHHNLGEIATSQQDWENAIASYDRAVKANPKSAASYGGMGKVFSAQGNYEKAISSYRQAISVDVNYLPAYDGMGEIFAAQEDWEAAIDCYQEIVEQYPDRSDIQHKLGDLLTRNACYEDAVEAYGNAIAINPRYSWSHNNLGDALSKLEEWEAAADAYSRAISLNPDFVWSHYNLGEALSHSGEWEGAIAAYRNALRIQPDLPYTQHKLGHVLKQRANRDLQEALACYRKAIQENPDELQNYHKALDIKPDDADLYVGLANALARQSNDDGAIVFYQIALQFKPELHDPRTQMERVKKNSLMKH